MIALLVAGGVAAYAQGTPTDSSGIRQKLDEAWWTGPMLAPSAATLPRGHFLIEPYLFDVTIQGQYDAGGTRHSAPHANDFGSLTYINYGLVDRLTVGLIPTAGYNEVSRGVSSAGVGLGDVTTQAQYRLAQFHEGRWIPTTSVALQETLPTGKYDRLDRASDGFGAGAFTTAVALYTQTYFWLPNKRILRVRFNAVPAFSRDVKLQDASVYGTQAGFRGFAKPGASIYLDASWEYSMTKHWVLALDATYRHQANTSVNGCDSSAATHSAVHLNSGASDAFGLAPAIEYSWRPTLGVLLGTRLIPAGRNTAASITPALAINFVH